jgi:hypothetical protein
MNVVMIVPTGIGAEIGGHAGDANVVACLLASVSDTLIIHPNVVNASDINEMTDNMLYVEGSILDRFLTGEINLKRVKANKVLVATNSPLSSDLVNSVSAAKVTLGLDASIIVLDTPLRMIATKAEDGSATGNIFGWQELVDQVRGYDFDALAVSSLIEVETEVAFDYMRNGGVNPWGGVEAKASKLIANALNKPVAHAPIDSDMFKDFKEVVDPRMAAETVSVSYIHCVLKGLHKAPRIGGNFSIDNIDCLVSPDDCYGFPHKACEDNNVPVIVVRENKTCLNNKMPENFIFVDNYLEAVGAIIAMREGISTASVRRPIAYTDIIS